MKKEELVALAEVLVLAEEWSMEVDAKGDTSVKLHGTAESVLLGLSWQEKVKSNLDVDVPVEECPAEKDPAEELNDSINQENHKVGDIVSVVKDFPNYSDARENTHYTVQMVASDWVELEGLNANCVSNKYLTKVSSLPEVEEEISFSVGDKVRVTTEGANGSNAVTGMIYTVEKVRYDDRYLRLSEIAVAGWVSFNNAEKM